MFFTDKSNPNKCPICNTELSNTHNINICSRCKYPINLKIDFKIINWGEYLWQCLESEKQTNQLLKEEKEKSVRKDKQNDQETSRDFEIFQKTIEQLSEPIKNLSHEINNLTRKISSSKLQQQVNSNFALNHNSEIEDDLKLSQQNDDSALDNEREYVEHNKSENNNLCSPSNLPEDNVFSETVNNNSLQFVEEYNRDKYLLFNKAIATVSETEESMNNRRDARDTPVQLEVKGSRGSYWIINEDGIYYLVPTSDIKFNTHKLDTVEVLFECDNYSNNSSEFQLIKPAKVSKIDSELWQLDKKGKLNFS